MLDQPNVHSDSSGTLQRTLVFDRFGWGTPPDDLGLLGPRGETGCFGGLPETTPTHLGHTRRYVRGTGTWGPGGQQLPPRTGAQSVGSWAELLVVTASRGFGTVVGAMVGQGD